MSDQADLSQRVTLDTTNYKAGVAELNRQIRVIESGFRASAAALGDWSKTSDGLEQRTKALTSEISAQQQKVDGLQSVYNELAASGNASGKELAELQIKINRETESLNKMEGELGRTEDALQKMSDEADDAADEVDDLEDKQNLATKASKKFGDALNALKGKLRESVGGLKDMVGNLAKVTAGMAVGLAGAAAGAVAGIGALVLKTAETSDELVELSDKVGIGVEQLQEYQYIAEQTGTGVEAVTGSLARMIRGMGDAQRGTGTAKDAFEALGVSVTDSNGNLRDSQDVFTELLGKLGEVEGETQRDAYAMQIFGRSAQELNPLIAAGADGLAQMAEEARGMGAVIGEDTVVSMAALNDRVAGIKLAFQGLVGELAGQFLPIADQLVAFISDTLVPWIGENLPVAIQILSDYWTNTLQPAILAVWNWMSTVLIPFLVETVYPWLQENIPKALQTLSDFWTNVLQPAILAVWNWMSTVLIPFLVNTVYPWLQENIPKALQTLSNFWENVLQPAIQTVWNWIATVLIPFFRDTVVPWLQENIPAAIQALADFWSNTLLPAITAIWEFIDANLVPIFEALWELFNVAGDLAITGLKKAWETTLLPALEGVWEFIDTNLMPIFEDLWSFLQDEVIPLLEGAFKKALEGISLAFDGIQKAIKWAVDKLKEFRELLRKVDPPSQFKAESPTPFEMGLRGIGAALQDLSKIDLPNFNTRLNQLSAVPAGSAAGGSVINQSYSYIIQAATPLQTSDDLKREIRLRELMHR